MDWWGSLPSLGAYFSAWPLELSSYIPKGGRREAIANTPLLSTVTLFSLFLPLSFCVCLHLWVHIVVHLTWHSCWGQRTPSFSGSLVSLCLRKKYLLFYCVYTRLDNLELLGMLISLCFICLWKLGETDARLHTCTFTLILWIQNWPLGLDYKLFCPQRHHINLLCRFSTRSNAQDFMIMTKVQRIHLVLEVENRLMKFNFEVEE